MPPERTPKRVRQACEPCRSVNFSAHITHEYGAVKVRIQLQKPLDVKAGQAINLWMWMPSVSFWSFLQSHPFVVISWAEKPQDHLDLFIEPRRGLTRELLYHAKSGHTMNPWVLFNGPHGKSIPIEDCENILIVASGFGIAAHLPYLSSSFTATMPVRFVLVVSIWSGRFRISILAISIYCESTDIGETSFGKRAKVYPGKALLREIFLVEVVREHIEKKLVDNIDKDIKILVEGELESEGQTKSDGQLLVTGEFPILSFWP
ncbi:uncharacterized protein PAC_17877 [Phialocephala subalpina]|uniref:FAD-binding FR-type domain-containing protein n=1 Tax=Phialocephala subalpina TaxID=576137 RepID=A0A1L7XSM9_9HELO|nr:uncharacterized protein PAC_17877 [Phialocephala subalpina]